MSNRKLNEKLARLERVVGEITPQKQYPTADKIAFRKPEFWVSAGSLLIAVASFIASRSDASTQRKSIDAQLQGLRDGVRIIAIGQGSAAQTAIDGALKANVKLPEAQYKQAQSTAKLLTRIAPENLSTWQTAAAITLYNSTLLENIHLQSSKMRSCFETPTEFMHKAILPPDKDILADQHPGEAFNGVAYANPGDLVVQSCTLVLDTLQLPKSVRRLIMIDVYVVFNGTSLPNVDVIILRNCAIHYEPNQLPLGDSKKLIATLLESNLSETIFNKEKPA